MSYSKEQREQLHDLVIDLVNAIASGTDAAIRRAIGAVSHQLKEIIEANRSEVVEN